MASSDEWGGFLIFGLTLGRGITEHEARHGQPHGNTGEHLIDVFVRVPQVGVRIQP